LLAEWCSPLCSHNVIAYLILNIDQKIHVSLAQVCCIQRNASAYNNSANRLISLLWQRRRYRSWRQTWFVTGQGVDKFLCQELVEHSRVQAEDGRMARKPVLAIDHKLDVCQLLEIIETVAQVAVIEMHQICFKAPLSSCLSLFAICTILKDCKVMWTTWRRCVHG